MRMAIAAITSRTGNKAGRAHNPAPRLGLKPPQPSLTLRLLSSCWVEYPLLSARRRAVLLLAAGLAATSMAGQSLRVAIATKLGESLNLHEVRTALAFDPANPELHRRLGQVYLFVMENIDPAEGIKQFRRAVELNPHLASSWTDLGSACDLVRDVACADRAFERALILNPKTPDLRWLAGNHYLSTNRSDAALAQFHRLLELSPSYAGQTFSLCLRVLSDPQVIFQKVLPGAGKDLKLSLAFINFLSTNGHTDYAYRVWVQTAATNSPFAFPLVKPYLDRLLELARYREAANVWRELERLGVIQRPRAEDADNVIYNGGFEQVPLNSGLDWHFEKEPYLAVDFSDPEAYQGLRCLRLDFSVNQNREYEPVYQIVPVVPNQRYALTAYVRSEGLTSDSGPRLRVLDAACSTCLNAATEKTVGTTPWHPLTLPFATAAQTEVVRLSVWRPRSRIFPAEIGGQFWVDAVSLRAVDFAGKRPALERLP